MLDTLYDLALRSSRPLPEDLLRHLHDRHDLSSARRKLIGARPDLPDDLAAAFGTRHDAASTIAWLTQHPQLPADVLQRQLDGESRVTVLTTVAARGDLTDDHARDLASRDLPAVAYALVRNKTVDNEVAVRCVPTLVAHAATKNTSPSRHDIGTLLDDRGLVAAALACEQVHYDLLHAVRSSVPADLLDRYYWLLAISLNLEPTPGRPTPIRHVRSVVWQLTNGAVHQRRGARHGAAHLLDVDDGQLGDERRAQLTAAVTIVDRYPDVAHTARYGTTDEVADLMALIDRSGARVPDDITRTVVLNPATPASVFDGLDLDTLSTDVIVELLDHGMADRARQLLANADPGRLLRVLNDGTFDPQLLRDAVVDLLDQPPDTSTNPCRYVQLAEQTGCIDQLPMTLVRQITNWTASAASVDAAAIVAAHLTGRLLDREREQLLASLWDTAGGTLGETIETCVMLDTTG